MKALSKSLAAALLVALALLAVVVPRHVYSQAPTLLFGSYLNNAKAVTVSSTGALNVTVGSGVIACVNGGTGLSSYAVGDLLYASAVCTLSKLADVVTGSVLVSGGVTTAPAWSATPSLTSLTLTGAIANPLIISASRNGQIQAQVCINTSTGTSAYCENLVKANDVTVNFGAEGSTSSDSFGKGRVYIDANSSSGVASQGGIDIIACDNAQPATCYMRFITNGYAAGVVRASIAAAGLTINNSLVLGFNADGSVTNDAGISRLGAASLAFGNGTAGSFTATLKATIANFVGSYQLNSVLMDSATAPTIVGGSGCTSPAVTHANGTAAFLLTLGTSCAGVKTIVLTMPAAAHFWAVDCENNTSDAAQALMVVASRATSPTAVTLTSYSRTLGTPLDYVASDTLLCKARAE